MASTPRERLESRLKALRSERSSYDSHWREISEYILPRRGRWLGQQAKNRGAKSNNRIVNSAATLGIRTTVAGMNSGLTNPSTRWFRLNPADQSLAEREGVRKWLDDVEDRIYEVLNASNCYQAFNSCYEEMLLFGAGPIWHDEDRENVCRFQALTAGEYMLATDESGMARICYREFEMTVAQVVERWGLDKVSRPTRQAFDNGEYEKKVKLAHALEPMSRRVEGLKGAKRWPYVSVYWETASDHTQEMLSVSGYEECPLHAPRWDALPGEAYGQSPCMDVLPDVKELQDAQQSKWVTRDRVAGRGPTQGPPLIGGSLDLSPGAHNQVPAGSDYSIRPIYVIPPAAVEIMTRDIDILERRIARGLYADLFLMFSMDERNQRATAEEIRAKNAEKLLVLGPMVLRTNTELYDPLIDRTYAILERASVPRWQQGLSAPLPPPPEALDGAELKIQYVSLLQQALQASKVSTIDSVLRVALAGAQADPSVMDKIDMDQVLDEVAGAVGAPAGVIRSDDAVAQLRQARQQAQQAREEMAMMAEAAKVAPSATKAMTDVAALQQGGAPAAGG